MPERRNGLLRGVVLSGMLWGAHSVAAEVPQLNLQLVQGVRAGLIADGTRLMRGRLAIQAPHDGFRVWMEAMTSGSQSNRYVLTGRQHSGHILHVRLEREGWQSDGPGGKGIALLTSEATAEFDMVADGDQQVAADSYGFDLLAATDIPVSDIKDRMP